jgi:hypothetical protein
MARPRPCLWRAAAVTAPAGAPGPWWRWIQVRRRDRCGECLRCAPVETTGHAAWQIRTGFSCTADLLLRRRVWGRRGVRFLLVVSAEAGPKETRRTKRFPVSGRGQRRISLQIRPCLVCTV